MLPPDNFQEAPKPAIAHRTSPTNIGLYLLSAVAARDFGWAGTVETVERVEATFASLQQLARFKGHFYNWYGTLDLQPLAPAYVSSVDSGNLAGHLIVLANACEEWIAAPLAADARAGVADNLRLAREAMAALPAASGEEGRQLAAILDEIAEPMKAKADNGLAPALKRLADKAAKAARELLPMAEAGSTPDLVFWIEAAGRALVEHGRDRQQLADAPLLLGARLKLLAHEARADGAGHGLRLPARPRAQAAGRSAIRWPTTGSIRAATTCSLPKRAWPACSPSPRATRRRATGSAWAAPRRRWAMARR